MVQMLKRWFSKVPKSVFTDGEIELHLTKDEEACQYNDFARTLYFEIHKYHSKEVIGCCELRLGMNESLYYLGQIGYSVYPRFRGNHTAYKACLILFDLAFHDYGMKNLIITCNPDNLPSYKTLQQLGGELKEIVEIPKNHLLYHQGDRQKCIFYYELKDIYARI